MHKILIPFDGSANALRAVRHAISMAQKDPSPQLELLHVLDPHAVRAHVLHSHEEILHLHTAKGERITAPAREILQHANLPFKTHYRVGAAATEIAGHVNDAGCDGIIMGTRGMGSIANIMIGSVATHVVHLVKVPVTLVK